MMNVEHRLLLWNSRWALAAGVVICTECLKSQGPYRIYVAFEHAAGCKAACQDDLFPWQSLRSVLDAARG